MSDEPVHDEAGAGTDAATAVSEPAKKLRQKVEIKDIGPCKKYLKVEIDRADIDDLLKVKFKELMAEANVPGFRPGKAPRKLVEKRYHEEVGDQVKSQVLMVSLEQLAEDHKLAPLSAPNLDPAKIDLPRQGPMVYEFEVEVRPEFDLPNYRGLKLKQPVHHFTEEDVSNEERRLLAPYGQVVPKPEGNAQLGDVLIADVVTRDGETVLSTIKEQQFRIDKQLAFKDGVASRFYHQVKGSNVGDKKVVDITLSSAVSNAALSGKTVQATFEIKDVKQLRLPELTTDFLKTFGVMTPGQLRELLSMLLRRRLEYQQRQSARAQVLEQIAAASDWKLPEDLLIRQARKTLARRIMEMRSEGISEEEINSRQRLMQQDVIQSTAMALKEHFVLQKVADIEKIDVSDDDVNDEIERMAAQNNESARRIRARLERDDLLDALIAEMIERKALDLILDTAEYEEVPLAEDDDAALSSVEAQTVPGAMREPLAAETPAQPEGTES